MHSKHTHNTLNEQINNVYHLIPNLQSYKPNIPEILLSTAACGRPVATMRSCSSGFRGVELLKSNIQPKKGSIARAVELIYNTLFDVPYSMIKIDKIGHYMY